MEYRLAIRPAGDKEVQLGFMLMWLGASEQEGVVATAMYCRGESRKKSWGGKAEAG